MAKHGSVSGQDILKMLNAQKEQAEIHSKVEQELKYYRTTIGRLLKAGRNNLSSGEFLL